MSPPSPDDHGPPEIEENDEVDVAIKTDHLGQLTPLGGSQVPPLRANNSVSDDIGKKFTLQNNQRPVSVPLPDLLTLHLSWLLQPSSPRSIQYFSFPMLLLSKLTSPVASSFTALQGARLIYLMPLE